MGVAGQRAVLDAIGVDWYVRRELVVASSVVPLTAPSGGDVAVAMPIPPQAPVKPTAPKNLAALVDDKPQAPVKPKTVAPEPAVVQPSEPEVQVSSPAPSVDAKIEELPFNWLVAECGPVQFVCDIKQAKLNGVWHAAAVELLSDIAKALRVKESLGSRYFNWPIVGPNGAPLQDVELDGFLDAFLEPNHDAPICILMGETAQRLASPLLMDKGRVIESVTLGELFTRPESKQALWQQLKPLLAN